VRELRAENKGLRLKNTELQGRIDGFEKEKTDAVAKAVRKVPQVRMKCAPRSRRRPISAY
jgi:regulator of replication initiation timing